MTAGIAETGPTNPRSALTSNGPVTSVSVVSTGAVQIHPQQVFGSRIPLYVWLVGSRSWTPPRPINAYVIEHADGLVLFDTGQDRTSVTDPDYFPNARLPRCVVSLDRGDGPWCSPGVAVGPP